MSHLSFSTIIELSHQTHSAHCSWRCPICPTALTNLVDVHEGLLDPLGQEALALGCAATIQQAQDAAAFVTSWHTHTHTHTHNTHTHTPHTHTHTHTPYIHVKNACSTEKRTQYKLGKRAHSTSSKWSPPYMYVKNACSTNKKALVWTGWLHTHHIIKMVTTLHVCEKCLFHWQKGLSMNWMTAHTSHQQNGHHITCMWKMPVPLTKRP